MYLRLLSKRYSENYGFFDIFFGNGGAPGAAGAALAGTLGLHRERRPRNSRILNCNLRGFASGFPDNHRERDYAHAGGCGF
jgi:hypothetical protein